jgi:hypothetical protein
MVAHARDARAAHGVRRLGSHLDSDALALGAHLLRKPHGNRPQVSESCGGPLQAGRGSKHAHTVYRVHAPRPTARHAHTPSHTHAQIGTCAHRNRGPGRMCGEPEPFTQAPTRTRCVAAAHSARRPRAVYLSTHAGRHVGGQREHWEKVLLRGPKLLVCGLASSRFVRFCLYPVIKKIWSKNKSLVELITIGSWPLEFLQHLTGSLCRYSCRKQGGRGARVPENSGSDRPACCGVHVAGARNAVSVHAHDDDHHHGVVYWYSIQ